MCHRFIHDAFHRTSLLSVAAFALILVGERQAQAQPDLVIKQVVVVNANTVHVQVRNIGSAPAGVCRMRMDIYSKFTGQYMGSGWGSVPSLQPGWLAWVKITSVVPNQPNRRLKFHVDVSNIVPESNEANNLFFKET
jgi:subtilase family serine protease